MIAGRDAVPMSRGVRSLVLSLAVAISWAGAGPAVAAAAPGTLSVQPGVVRPGGSVTVCGGGFSFVGDRVVFTRIDGVGGPHTAVRSDGSACVVLRHSFFREPYNRYVPLVLTARGPTGVHTDTGRVFVSDSRLPFTGATATVPAAVAGLASLLLGLLLLALGRQKGPSGAGTSSGAARASRAAGSWR